MEYISSDTNIWIDFMVIDRLELPFRLPHIYLMNQDAAEDELLAPPGLGQKLVELGLHKVELTEEEFYLAEEYISRYKKISLYDAVALAIAKVRKIKLLTGDGGLRRAAAKEEVEVIGTIGILDRLYREHLVDASEYLFCLQELLRYNGKKVRLPEAELRKRIGDVR